MGLFIIGGNPLNANKCLDLAEELVEKGLVDSSVEITKSRLDRWQDELARCKSRGGKLYGFLLEQFSAQTKDHRRVGAFCIDNAEGSAFKATDVLSALIELSKAIHRDDIPTCDDWLFESLGDALKQNILFDAMDERERKELIGIAKSAVRHLQHYKDPIFFQSEELPSMFFISERGATLATA